MQDKNIEQVEVSPEMQEAIAAYFEQHNGGEISRTPETWLSEGQQTEWEQTQTLLNVPQRLLVSRPVLDAAWASFKVRAFEMPVTAEGSLGAYVASALDTAEQTTLHESGLSRTTLEALKVDNTPIEKLKDYELNDYAALARRYNIKDNAFPRMLKWLKGLGKSLTTAGLNLNRGMVFARDEEVRQPGLSEAELAASLEQKDQPDEASSLETEK